MAAPVPPGPEEQGLYYVGLPSRPKLVARSSTDPWKYETDGFWDIKKPLKPVSNHPILEPWNDSTSALRQGVLKSLQGIDWTAIDVFRLGYDPSMYLPKEYGQPVTILISVKKDSTSWEQGHKAVMACHAVLQECGIHDVHVEMKQPR
ncbi:hypothetical protein ACHAPT_000423 [Fusarium lateritium]